MKACGIVAEYNPLHKGHEYHIKKSKEITGADAVVAVMSGSFTQRGEVASFDKWTRARAAVAAGVNLVVELPFCFACAPAEIFAEGSTRLLDKIGCKYISFGSESGDMEALLNMAKSSDVKEKMEKYLAQGKSYSSAYALASETDFTPNNILAIEYLKAIEKYRLNIEPVTIKRSGNAYDSEEIEDGYISAKACRKLIAEKDFESLGKNMPSFEMFKDCLESGKYADMNLLGSFFAGLVRTGRVDFENAAYISEGIENRIKKAAEMCGDIKGIAENIKTKRYTHTRIMRIISCMMMGLGRDKLDKFVERGPLYIRVLAADETGVRLMKEIKRGSSLDIITNLGSADLTKDQREMITFDIAASDLLNLAMINKDYSKANEDYTHFFERI